jgi:dTDP-4-dehydrorhamnose reductase
MLAEITSLLIARAIPNPLDFFCEKRGIYHLAGSGAASRFDFVKEVLSLDPHPEEQKVKVLAPALTKDFPLPACRPLATPLDCSHFERVFGLHLPPWEGALRLAMNV